MSRESYMRESAETHLAHGDMEAYDAIMMAVDDLGVAKKKYPSQKEAIKNAIEYANQETGHGRFG
jgi:hypothetical protein